MFYNECLFRHHKSENEFKSRALVLSATYISVDKIYNFHTHDPRIVMLNSLKIFFYGLFFLFSLFFCNLVQLYFSFVVSFYTIYH